MIDTPKARELGLPWASQPSGLTGYSWVVDRYQKIYGNATDGVASDAYECVNLIGPHLDDPDRMAAFRAVAGMDADLFAVFMDWMRERGFVEM